MISRLSVQNQIVSPEHLTFCSMYFFKLCNVIFITNDGRKRRSKEKELSHLQPYYDMRTAVVFQKLLSADPAVCTEYMSGYF